MWVVSFTPRPLHTQRKLSWCLLNMWLVGPHSRSGNFVEEKNNVLAVPGVDARNWRDTESSLLVSCSGDLIVPTVTFVSVGSNFCCNNWWLWRWHSSSLQQGAYLNEVPGLSLEAFAATQFNEMFSGRPPRYEDLPTFQALAPSPCSGWCWYLLGFGSTKPKQLGTVSVPETW